jgi:transcriptional regulator with XRE-family HTH domain
VDKKSEGEKKLSGSSVLYVEQGLALKKLRNQVGLSQSELAKAANIALSTLVKLERGERIPGHELKESLARALGTASSSSSAATAADGGTGTEIARQLLAIDWPAPYAIQSYNYREPNSAPQGSPGAKLKQLRLAKGLSQAQVALQLGLPEHKFARLERGNVKTPDPKMLKALSAILGDEVYTIFPSSADAASAPAPSFSE